MMNRRFGTRNASRDSRKMHVLQAQASTRTTSALDYWDQLVTLHYGGREGICAHFREATIAETEMAWAGAPFAAPMAAVLDLSILTVSAGQDRSFLYQPMPAANHYNKLASVAPRGITLGSYVGIRLDDGTDNNYTEVVLRVSQASPTQWTVRTLLRLGGGVVLTQDGDAMNTPPGFVLEMSLVWTTWADWYILPVLYTNMGFGGRMYKPNASLGGINFTPTRAGLIFDASTTARADWFDIGRA